MTSTISFNSSLPLPVYGLPVCALHNSREYHSYIIYIMDWAVNGTSGSHATRPPCQQPSGVGTLIISIWYKKKLRHKKTLINLPHITQLVSGTGIETQAVWLQDLVSFSFWLWGLWDLSSPTRDQTWALGSESTESQLLDGQGIPWSLIFNRRGEIGHDKEDTVKSGHLDKDYKSNRTLWQHEESTGVRGRTLTFCPLLCPHLASDLSNLAKFLFFFFFFLLWAQLPHV